MHKVVVFFAFLFLTLSYSWASENSCYSTLTNDNDLDSRHYTIDLDKVDVRDFRNDYVAQAIAYVRVLLDEEGCSKKDVNFGKGPHGRSKSRCNQIVRGRPYSRVCYIETNLGYFVVTQDFLTTVHITYNRWD